MEGQMVPRTDKSRSIPVSAQLYYYYYYLVLNKIVSDVDNGITINKN